MNDPKSYRRRLDPLLAEFFLAARQAEEEGRTRCKAEKEVLDTVAAQRIIQEVAEQVQRKAHVRIASVVTRCLKAVFGADAYEFGIEFEQKRGKTEARMVFRRGELEADPLSAAGGGMVDVAAFALRVACIVLARPPRRGLLFLDEPYRFVNGREYQERVGGMLEVLAEELGIQLVIVTDDDWLKIGKVVSLD